MRRKPHDQAVNKTQESINVKQSVASDENPLFMLQSVNTSQWAEQSDHSNIEQSLVLEIIKNNTVDDQALVTELSEDEY